MIRRKAAVFRLYPTPEQAEQLAQIVGACRFVYNLALEQRRDFWRQYRRHRGINISFASQCRELTDLRREVDWLRAVPVHVLQQALRDLRRAYVNFFKGLAGYPTPRRKGINDACRFPDPKQFELARTGTSSGRLKLPKLGWIRLREKRWRALSGEPCNVTVSRKAGQWFAAIQYEQEVAEPAASALPPVGIDLGVAAFATLHTGKRIEAANHGKKALRALRGAQRALARKKRGSRNRLKAICRVARIQRRVANARKDFLHKHSTDLAKNHGAVVVEALRVRNMSASAKGTAEEPGRNVRQKAGLNRSILDQGWGAFRIMLAYKLAERGGRLIQVPAVFSSQTCTACGYVDACNRRDQATFVCVACGHADHADVNAAINILRRADLRVEACGGTPRKRPVEAGTIRSAA